MDSRPASEAPLRLVTAEYFLGFVNVTFSIPPDISKVEGTMTFQRLIDGCVDGDKECFRLLYEETKDGIFRLIRARVRNREEALDILQETYIDLWKALSGGKFSYSSDGEFFSFLCIIARRRVARLYRFFKPVVSLEDLSDVVPDSDSRDPGEIAFVLDMVEKLNAIDREVIRLRYFEGLEFKIIARFLEQKEGAIKIRHHRALTKLRELLKYEKEN